MQPEMIQHIDNLIAEAEKIFAEIRSELHQQQTGGDTVTLKNLITNPDRCNECYMAGADWIFKQTGKTSNACAATASAYLIAAGLLTKHFAATADLARHLLKLGWKPVLFITDLKPADVIFTADLTDRRGYPDHVCICHSINGAEVKVLDNYSPSPKIRNMQSGPRTPFGWALRQP